MLSALLPVQRDLADLMSSLSERAYAAGWIEGLEYELWYALSSASPRLGPIGLSKKHIAELQKLSEECGGWIRFDNQNEETFVPIARWQEYAAEAAASFYGHR